MKINVTTAHSIFDVDAHAWDACAEGRPFLQHAFFAALERSAAADPMRGVEPEYLLLHDAGGRLMACTPTMRKTGTLAEYGPEHLWLRRGIEEGCFHWPKYQCGVPMMPICGPRLMVHPDAPRARMETALARALRYLGEHKHRSDVVNVLHVEDRQARMLEAQGWLLSSEQVGFWDNAGYASFEEYLSALPHRKRYIARAERRRAASLGLQVRVLDGTQITPALLDDYYAGHAQVCLRYGNRPWLPPETFSELAARMPHAVRLIAMFEQDRFVAGVFCLVDHDTLYVRTWSAREERAWMALELICYRPILYAIEHRLAHVNSGIGGEHKRHRGFVDRPVYSAHWFFSKRLAELAREALTGQIPVN